MTPKALLEEILKLPPDERLDLISEVWDSLTPSPESVPVSDWHKAELDHILDNPSPEPPQTWEEVQRKLRKSR
ncbi:MAG: addiction module protein [Gemmatimonadetes bacterium]|nr:addiction module protein [Gemmatimonadota bacterium]